MNKVNNISLEDQARQYAITPKSPQGSILYIHKKSAFEAGAQWQKEQDKIDFKRALEDIKEMGRVIRMLDNDCQHSDLWLMDEGYVPDTQYLENK